MLEAQLDDELEQQSHLDVTLTNTTLLAMFFGLVIVCGVFFGFGYSLGGHKAVAQVPVKEFTSPRPIPQPTPQPSSPSSSQAAPVSTKAAAMPRSTIEPASPKPSAGVATSTSGSQPTQSAASLPAVIAPAKSTSAATTTNRSDVSAAAKTKPVSSANAPSAAALSPADAAAPGKTYMVQVAALAHPGDADILCNALRRKGYNVIMASSKQDKLLHVQVGPFASMDAARTMRDKLTSDGYSPILK